MYEKFMFLFYLNVVFVVVHVQGFSQWFGPYTKQKKGMKENKLHNENVFLNSQI